MNKKSKWLMVLGLATTIAGSGIVMAATAADQQQGEKTDMRGPHPMGCHMKHGEKDHKALLELLQIDEAAFREEMKAGKTLSQIAGEHGVSEQDVIDLEKQEMAKHIEEGVKAGRLTAEQAEKMQADLEQRAEQMVKFGPGPRAGGKDGQFGHQHRGFAQDNKALLELLQIDEATFREEMKAGKTLSQIAGEHGVAEQTVIDQVKQHMAQRIEEGVKAGRLTAEQAEKMQADLAQRAEQMVKSGPGPREGCKPGGFGPHERGGQEAQGSVTKSSSK